MKRLAIALAAVAAAAACVGAPAARQAAADPPARGGDDLAGKFLGVNVRQSGGATPTLLQKAAVKRLGNREFLAGEIILPPDSGAEWQGAVVMVPLDQVDTIVVFDDRDKALKVMKDTAARAAQAAGGVPSPAAGVAPPPGTVPGGLK